jgi:hypothetical protein
VGENPLNGKGMLLFFIGWRNSLNSYESMRIIKCKK